MIHAFRGTQNAFVRSILWQRQDIPTFFDTYRYMFLRKPAIEEPQAPPNAVIHLTLGTTWHFTTAAVTNSHHLSTMIFHVW
jgi:hypothetical protein